MIYYVECIPSGTFLLQELYSKYPLDDLELGCFFGGLLAFLREPSLGGRSAAGYGQVEVIYRIRLDNSRPFEVSTTSTSKLRKTITDAVLAYNTHLEQEKELIIATLKAELLEEGSGEGSNKG